MGTAKFAFIPRIYSKDFVIEQAKLDDFNAVEIAVNVNGEGTIRCTPTSDEYTRTVVYKCSDLGTFGRLVGSTGTSIYNSFTADVDVQITIASSLAEGSKYILLFMLCTDIPSVVGGSDLDISVEGSFPFLIADGTM